ncbi:hypothetical protein LCGC14_1185660 [marine sediment metagenome]|uniref:Uncharacterized protein n=1 Tax=marine sediment metagenome TaxID=412755 RepID=A0A0F9LQP8_9ZZZZ
MSAETAILATQYGHACYLHGLAHRSPLSEKAIRQARAFRNAAFQKMIQSFNTEGK